MSLRKAAPRPLPLVGGVVMRCFILRSVWRLLSSFVEGFPDDVPRFIEADYRVVIARLHLAEAVVEPGADLVPEPRGGVLDLVEALDLVGGLAEALFAEKGYVLGSVSSLHHSLLL